MCYRMVPDNKNLRQYGFADAVSDSSGFFKTSCGYTVKYKNGQSQNSRGKADM